MPFGFDRGGSSFSALSSIAAMARASVMIPAHMVPVAEKTQKQRDNEAEAAYWRAFRRAEMLLMHSGGKDRPRGSTVRRLMRTLGAGGPGARGAVIKRGDDWVHPTKGHAARA